MVEKSMVENMQRLYDTSEKYCNHCGQESGEAYKLMKCACKAVYYCRKAEYAIGNPFSVSGRHSKCQKEDWAKHKLTCTKFAEGLEGSMPSQGRAAFTDSSVGGS